MELFYPTVVIIALLCLVIFLTFIGLMMKNDKSTAIYPPTSNVCPDYWVSDSKGNCFIPERKSFSDKSVILNTGNSGCSLLSKKNVAPYSSDGRSFSSKNPLWTSKGETTICAQKNWSINNNIVWDGVSNYNMC